MYGTNNYIYSRQIKIVKQAIMHCKNPKNSAI